MAGTEFWLSPNLVRFFLPHIPLLNGTGMIIVVEFVTCKCTFICKEISLSTTCKIIACRTRLKNHSVFLISAYRPQNTVYELYSTLSSIILFNPNDVIWLDGSDLNLPQRLESALYKWTSQLFLWQKANFDHIKEKIL